MPSVSGVSGAARTTKSDSARSSGSCSGAKTWSSVIGPSRRILALGADRLRARLGPAASATTRLPNAVARAPTAAPDRAQPDDPDGDVAQLSALERLPGPLALELEELGQPA